MKYWGNPNCTHVYARAKTALKYAAMEVYNKFPDAQDRVLTLGDSSGKNCNCPNHPMGSHASMSAIDVDYYTTLTNHTQYARPRTKMWSTDGITLIPNVFDAERNACFLNAIRSFLPKAKARTNIVLLRELLKVDSTLGKMINGADFGGTYYHHIHFHIELYDR